MESEEGIRKQLEELKKQLEKKDKFEDAVASVRSLFRDRYPSASPSLRKSFYTVVSRAATVLRTRHTAPGFWLAGLELFKLAEVLTPDAVEKAHLKKCVSQAKDQLEQIDAVQPQPSSRRGYLFEGHLTVDPEPPQPRWLVQSNLMNALMAAESSAGAGATALVEENGIGDLAASVERLIQDSDLDNIIPLLEILDGGSAVPRRPPASKEVVANLPIIALTEEILGRLGQEAECAICKENLVVGDKMQELPCKHTFHPPCLKPWLDEHNSCPICRHELRTDDHSYESRKEKEKEDEEERKGAANALRGGEYMYV